MLSLHACVLASRPVQASSTGATGVVCLAQWVLMYPELCNFVIWERGGTHGGLSSIGGLLLKVKGFVVEKQVPNFSTVSYSGV